MASHKPHPSGIARKRSASRIPVGQEDHEDDEREHEGGRRSSFRSGLSVQTVVLLACCCGGLLLALQLTRPAAHPNSRNSPQQQPKCYPLDDKDKVRMLGPQNQLVDYTVATASSSAQTLFNLGLLQLYGFNQHEATNMFQAALRYDPACAMCQWGLAQALGPFPNKVSGAAGDKYPVFHTAAAQEAYQHMQHAQRSNDLALQSSSLDKALVKRDRQLIQLSLQRFEKGVKAVKHGDWAVHERRYADALAKLAHELKPQVSDIYALAAEAFMNLVPWDYYDPVSSQLKGAAATAEKLVLKALQLNPQHLLALHLHIHLAEAGVAGPQVAGAPPAAGRALDSARALVSASPQHGHLIHMPSHVFVRVGDYVAAVEVNQRAYDFDVARASHCMVPYLPEHNVNMLIYAASMAGMYHTAEGFAKGVRNLRERVSDMWMGAGNEWVSLPLLWARHGQWDLIMRMPAPPKDARGVTRAGGFEYSMVVYHYARALALAAKAAAAEAAVMEVQEITAIDLLAHAAKQHRRAVSKQLKHLQDAAAAIPKERQTRPGEGLGIYASSYGTLAQVHIKVVQARVALLSNNTAAAAELLQDAIAVEDSIGYMEPPRLAAPVRQCLGWVLLQTGHWQSARKVYQQDLQRHHANGWSLLGLEQSLQAGVADSAPDAAEELQQELEQVQQQRAAAWARAEVKLHSSCPALSTPWAL